MNGITLLSIKEKVKWASFMKRLPLRVQDAYYLPEYYEIYENYGDGKAQCFILDDGKNILLYPFIINNINALGYDLDDNYYDIQGAYGYNGILSSTNDISFINNFNGEFYNYCIKNNIIAEFTRFHPLLKNERLSKGYLDIIYNRQTVYIDLSFDYNIIYQNFSRSVKNNLRKSQEENLKLGIYKNEFPFKNEFINMYYETMKRVNAIKYICFNEKYFDDTFNLLPVIQFVVSKGSMPLASAICLNYKNYLHIHLEASKQEYLHLRPNDFLINEIIKYGIENSYKKILLGGGRTRQSDDALLRFKKKFSNNLSDFYIGKKIYNDKIYADLCHQWQEKYHGLVNEYENYTLKYRYKNDIPDNSLKQYHNQIL